MFYAPEKCKKCRMLILHLSPPYYTILATRAASLVAQMVKRLSAMQGTQLGGLGRSPGEGNGSPLQYS